MVNIKRDAEFLKTLFDLVVVFINNSLRGSSLLFGFYSDGRAVLIRAANVNYIFLLKSQVSYKNIGRQVSPGQMTNMQRAIGVWQRRSNCVSFKFIKL